MGRESTEAGEKVFDLAAAIKDLEDEPGETGNGGVSQDAADMHRMGNQQQLKRNFHSLAVLGLTCVLINTWSSILSGSAISLINGGRAGSVWMYLISWICTMPVIASLAEMASMAPSAAGQYHWVSEFAPSNIQKFMSYIIGWLAALSWQTILAGSAYGSSVMVTTMVSLAHPSYEPTKWHVTLLTIGIATFAVLFNIFCAKKLPLFEGVILFLFFFGFFIVILPLWIMAPKVAAKEVFTSFSNFGNWSSIPAAVIIGQTAAFTALLGADAAAHMSEEVKHASVAVPRMMLLTIIINGILGFIMIITFVFAIEDIEEQILKSTSPLPYIAVFAKATSSAITIGMMVPIVIMDISSSINSVMAASRQAWSFARDDGLPNWFKKITTVGSTPLPLNAMIGSLGITVIIALLNLAGSEIIGSLFGLVGAATATTYTISIGSILWRRLYGDEPLPPSKFSLGRFAVPINAFAVVYETYSTIISFFPLFSHVNAEAMNWGVAVFGGVAILCAIYYLVNGRKRYCGPVVRIVKDD